MGLWDLFKPKKQEQQINKLGYAPTFTGTTPNDYSYGSYTEIDQCDLLLQTIHAKQAEMSKIKPRHIVRNKEGVEVVDETSSISKVFRRPNLYMTWADFISKIVFLREVNENCYIYPEYTINNGKKTIIALYPLNPTEVKYLIDASNNYFIEFTFANGYKNTLPVNEVIHWRKNYDRDDYFGGGNDKAKVDLYNSIVDFNNLRKSIAKAVNASCQINGIVKLNSYLNNEQVEADKAEFLNNLHNNESGILFTDLKAEYVAMPHDVKLVDSESLDFFYEAILRSTGTPKEILSGNYTKQVKESWYERCIEPDLTSLAQAMEKVLFTDREMSYNNKIILYPAAITFMSMENKISALQVGLPAGIFTRNEAREILGFPPLTGDIGKEIPQGFNLVMPTEGTS